MSVNICPFAFLVFVCSSLPVFVCTQSCERNPVIFMFGDSNSDTGGVVAGIGASIGASVGRIYFHQPSGRLCDGRLVIDFLCESLNISYLTPYLESLGSNFTNGANFAISGSSTLPKSVPFSLAIQVRQFLHFQLRSLELISKGFKNMISDEAFKNAMYIIDIGQNDLAGSLTYLSYPQVIEKIPHIIVEIKYAIQNLYQHGGTKVLVHNTGPLGCLPQQLATTNKNDTDQYGCLKSRNKVAEVFNEQLGFKNPLMACCGYGGAPYNYDPNTKCGQFGYNVCEEGSRFISWDGVHYTEAANSIVASKLVSTYYSTAHVQVD